MHARITNLQVRTDRFYEASRAVEQEILPHLRQERGFRHIYVLADRQTGRATVITLWATEEEERASRHRIDQRLGRIAYAIVGQPEPGEAMPVIFEASAEGSHR